MSETSYSSNPISPLLGLKDRLYFPVSLAVRSGHVIKLGSMVYEWRGGAPLLGLTHKNLRHESFILLPLPARTANLETTCCRSMKHPCLGDAACQWEHLFKNGMGKKYTSYWVKPEIGGLSVKNSSSDRWETQGAGCQAAGSGISLMLIGKSPVLTVNCENRPMWGSANDWLRHNLVKSAVPAGVNCEVLRGGFCPSNRPVKIPEP